MTNIMFLMRVAVVFFLGGMAARDVDAFDQNAANNNVGDEQALEIPALERLDSCDPIPHDLSIAVQSFQVVGDIICHKPRVRRDTREIMFFLVAYLICTACCGGRRSSSFSLLCVDCARVSLVSICRVLFLWRTILEAER